MSSDNQSVVKRWWEELWNQGNLAVADQIVAPNFTDHDPASPWVPPGIDGCKTLVTGYRTVFPDIHFAIEQEVAAGDKVVSHWRCRGTHRAELMGIPATGKTIDVEGISILHLDHGKITHQTTIWDAFGMMRQLGALPASPPAAT